MFESDADRLALIQAVGEQFSAGNAESFWGVFDRAYDEASLGGMTVGNRRPLIQCRTSDAKTQALVKGSKVTRLEDASEFYVKDFEPDGTGMTLLVLRS